MNNEWSISSKIFSGVTPLEYAFENLKVDLFGNKEGKLEAGNTNTLYNQDQHLRDFLTICLDK